MSSVFVLTDCQYTCHHKCRQLVTLDCASVSADNKANAEQLQGKDSETSLGEDQQAVRQCGNQVLNHSLIPPKYNDTSSHHLNVGNGSATSSHWINVRTLLSHCPCECVWTITQHFDHTAASFINGAMSLKRLRVKNIFKSTIIFL